MKIDNKQVADETAKTVEVGNNLPDGFQSQDNTEGKTTTSPTSGMYDVRLEKLIEISLLDGDFTEKKKQILFRKAESLGIDLDEFEMVLDARLYERQQKEAANNADSIIDKIKSTLPTKEGLQNVWDSAKNVKVFDNFHNKVSGRQAYLDHKKAKKLKTDSEAKYEEYSNKTAEIQQDLNRLIEEYGRQKLETLKRTVGVFLSYLEKMEQKYKENYYELMDGCDFPKAYIAELGQLNMNTNELLKTAGTSGGLAIAAVAGIPSAVTSVVGALATASTGVSISTLSGTASTNAILAWLGGGSIAAGGGGIAAGTVVLAGITYTATGLIAIASAGLVASSIYAKKLTQAQAYSAEVDIACEKMENAWAAMAGIEQRVIELRDITMNVYDKCIIQLSHLEPLVSNFDTNSKEQVLIFQKAALLIKSMSELAKTPLFGDDMNLSEQGEAIITKTRKILNTEL
jgi:hypothetical protein